MLNVLPVLTGSSRQQAQHAGFDDLHVVLT
jgi:hypothetical protein